MYLLYMGWGVGNGHIPRNLIKNLASEDKIEEVVGGGAGIKHISFCCS